MSNTWERAFGSITPNEEDDLKIKQRKIQHQDWEKEFPDITSGLTKDEQLIKLLQDNNLYEPGLTLVANISNIVAHHKKALAQIANLKNAFK